MPKSKSKLSTDRLPGAFSLFSPSWEAVKLNLDTFLQLILIPILISFLRNLIQSRSSNIRWLSLDLLILQLALDLIFAPALIVTQLMSVQGKRIDFIDSLKRGFPFVWRFLGLGISLFIIIFAGFIAFIIPGIIFLRRYYLAPYYLIDQNMKVFEALKVSAIESKPVSWAIYDLLGVDLLFAVACIILIGFVLIFMYYCAPAVRYHQIKSLKSS